MLNLDIPNGYTTAPRVVTTLWHCDRCNAFISIHSAQPLGEPFCPACGEVMLDFCGRLNSMLGVQFGDA
jgi:hypothetical protein